VFLANLQLLAIHTLRWRLLPLYVVLGYDNFLSLVFIVGVDRALASMILQLKLVELLLRIAQRYWGLALDVFLQVLATRPPLDLFLLVQQNLVWIVARWFGHNLRLVDIEVVDDVSDVGYVAVGLRAVGLELQRLLSALARLQFLLFLADPGVDQRHLLLLGFGGGGVVGRLGVGFGLQLELGGLFVGLQELLRHFFF